MTLKEMLLVIGGYLISKADKVVDKIIEDNLPSLKFSTLTKKAKRFFTFKLPLLLLYLLIKLKIIKIPDPKTNGDYVALIGIIAILALYVYSKTNGKTISVKTIPA